MEERRKSAETSKTLKSHGSYKTRRHLVTCNAKGDLCLQMFLARGDPCAEELLRGAIPASTEVLRGATLAADGNDDSADILVIFFSCAL